MVIRNTVLPRLRVHLALTPFLNVTTVPGLGVDFLLGDPSKAKDKLGWEIKTSFEELVKLMVESDLELAKKERSLCF